MVGRLNFSVPAKEISFDIKKVISNVYKYILYFMQWYAKLLHKFRPGIKLKSICNFRW